MAATNFKLMENLLLFLKNNKFNPFRDSYHFSSAF